ncbi:LegC family aminotransferase [Achromobacter insolitus]|uniref:LegC family aminotransferase n=1 Tax=Achromobacter insolitus TaxID=217204 RepID=UPI0027E12EE5|nr:LegC family aminotransferase [Achromobacter insolitus]MDQ6212207.1 LegC family aminotransferase [Achromobacter insolitus]
MINNIIGFVREKYRTNEFIPLHAPVFGDREKKYVLDTIDSTFVSSVGAYVDRFENDMAKYTGAERAVATVNGTAALHVALKLVGVGLGDYVVTQPLTFVATCNAISYCGAKPIFADVDRDTLGLSARSVDDWLEQHAYVDDDGVCRLRSDNGAVKACVPMHTFGHPVRMDELISVCGKWRITLVEDAAESLGSTYKGKHAGTLGKVGVQSFNGNKIITTGGGGMILADAGLGAQAKHMTTTAKQPHPYNYVHDEVGFNYRLPNLNAALGCAQLERLDMFVEFKRTLAASYQDLLKDSEYQFVVEPQGCRSNYWLNAVICESREARQQLLAATNQAGVMTRPIWALMSDLSMYKNCKSADLQNARWLEERVVNLPSSFVEPRNG